jgi:hypothetical protein
MGIIDSGPLGPFRKKIGAAIGRRHMGQDLVLPLYHKTTKKPTQDQLLQREKFKMLRAFFAPLKKLVNPGFKAYAKKKSPANAAFSYNFDHAFVMDGEELELNFPKLVISRGPVDTPNGLQLTSAPKLVHFSWEAAPQSTYCQSTDQASVVVYNAERKQFSIRLNVAERSALGLDVDLSENYSGQVLHCWIVFSSADGKVPGDSKYAGEVLGS